MTDRPQPPLDGRGRLFEAGYSRLTLALTLHLDGTTDNAELFVTIHEQGDPDDGLVALWSEWLNTRNEPLLFEMVRDAVERARAQLLPFG